MLSLSSLPRALSRTIPKSTLSPLGLCLLSTAHPSTPDETITPGFGNVKSQLLQSSFTPLSLAPNPYLPNPKTVQIVSAPFTFGQPFSGTDKGPEMLFDRGLEGGLSSLGWRLEKVVKLDFKGILRDLKSKSGVSNSSNGNGNETGVVRKFKHKVSNAKNSESVGLANKHIASEISKACAADNFPLLLGGDHSVAIGSLAGVLRARPNTSIIWIDAHADLNTPEISDSGNMHGMPLGLLVREMGVDHNDIKGLEWLSPNWKGDHIWPAYKNRNENDETHEEVKKRGEEWGDRPPRLDARNLVYVGLRDVDLVERHAIRSLNIKCFTMYDIDNLGIGRVMDLAIEHLQSVDGGMERPIHMSYDIDAIDPSSAPSTGTRVRGGLTFREAHFVAERVANCGMLSSADLVELNPSIGEDGGDETADLGIEILNSFMGKSII